MQASGPLLDPMEMANTNEDQVAQKIAKAKYSGLFKPLFGPNILNQPAFLVSEALSALARYQVEDPSFHRFDSKYDAWLEGRARLSPTERRGLQLFNDRTAGQLCRLSPERSRARRAAASIHRHPIRGAGRPP